MKIKKKLLVLIFLIIMVVGLIFSFGKLAKSNTKIAKAFGIKTYSESTEEISPESIAILVEENSEEENNEEKNILVKLDTEISLIVKILPENVNINNGLIWTSSDIDVAEVNQNGVVTGKKIGKATITVTTENGKEDTQTVVVGPNNDYIDIKNRPLETFAGNFVPQINFNNGIRSITAHVMQNFLIDKENKNIYITQYNSSFGLFLTKFPYTGEDNNVTVNEPSAEGYEYMRLPNAYKSEFLELEKVNDNGEKYEKIWLDNTDGINIFKDVSNTTDKINITNDSIELENIDIENNKFAIDFENDFIVIRTSSSSEKQEFKIYKLSEFKNRIGNGENIDDIPVISTITHDTKISKDILKNTDGIENLTDSMLSNISSEAQGFDIDGSYIYIMESLTTQDANLSKYISTFENNFGKSNIFNQEKYYGDTYISIYDLSGKEVDGYYRYNMEAGLHSEVEKEGKKSLEDLDFYSKFISKDEETGEYIYTRYQGQGIKVYDGQLYTGYSLVKTEADKNQNILYLAEKKVIGMTIKENPTKMIYTIGEKLDTTGMKLLVEYEYGEDQEVTEGFTCTPIEFNTAGKQEITVEYEGKTATFEVEVKKKTIDSTGIINKLKSEVYLYDSEAKSITIPETEEWPEGLLNITPTYIKGINLDGEEVEKPIEVGTYIVKLNFEVEENYEIISTQYRYLDIFDIPKNLKGTVGDKLETIEFKDGEKEYPGLEWNNPAEVFSLDKENYKAIYTPENENFDGISVEIDIPVTVINPIIGIELPEDLKKDYILGEELENFEGKKIKVIYKNGDMQEIDMTFEEVQITGHNKELWEKQAITVTYDGFSVNYEIRNRKNVSITNLIKNEVHIYEKGLEQWITIPGQENWPEGISNITKKLGPNSVAKGKPEEPGIYDINIEFEVVDEDKYVKPPVITVYLEIFEIPTDIKGNDGQKLEDIGLPDRFKWEDGNQTLNLEQEKYLATYTSYVDINSTLITKEIEIPVKILSTITWINEDGTVLEIDDNVEAGIIPSYDGTTPTKEKEGYTYKFTGWTPDLVEVTGNVTYTAKYEETVNIYTIEYDLAGGTSVEENPETYTIETESFTLKNPKKEGYTFKGWTGSNGEDPQIELTIEKGTIGNKEYTAIWTPNTDVSYKVKYLEKETNRELKTEEIRTGKTFDVEYKEEAKEITGYIPEVEFKTIKLDAYNKEVVFYYTVRLCTVTWVDEDGTILEKDENVPYGTTPSYDGETPKKEVDEQYIYVFVGWDPEITKVVENAVYRVKYQKIDRPQDLSATYGEKLSDVELPEGFSWKESTDTSVGPVGENDFTLIYTPEDTDNYKVVEIPVKVVVEKAEPTYEVPTGIEGKEGQKLEEIELPDGFEWKYPDTIIEKPEEGDTAKYPVIYRPEDTDNYNEVEIEVPVSIYKNIIDMSQVIFRDKILIYDGKEHWVEIQGELPVGIKSVSYEGNVQINAGEYTVIAKFEVEEGYNAVEDLKATLIILKAVPVYKISTSLTAIYGEKLSDVELPEGFSWKESTDTSVGPVGENDFTLIYTPEDTDNYKVVEIPVKVVVEKAEPTYEVPTEIEGKEGQKLEEIELPDGFEWKNPETILEKPEEGDTVKYPVIYSPEDTDNYNEVELEVAVTIYKNIVDMSKVVFEDKTVTYNGESHSIEIQGELPIGIKAVSYEGNGQIKAGEYTVIAKFEVEETYAPVEDKTAKLIIEKAEPTYEVPTGIEGKEGQKLEEIELPDGFEWKNPETVLEKPEEGNTEKYPVIYSPEDTDNYNEVELEIPVSIKIIELVEIQIKSNPNKTEYIIGESLDLEGLSVIAKYSDDSEINITDRFINQTGILNEVGEQEITLEYEGKTASFTINVVERLEVNIEGYEEYIEDNDKYIKVKPYTTLEELLKGIKANEGATVTVFKDLETIADYTQKVETKMRVEITLGTQKITYTTILMGDVNGDGKADLQDMIKINTFRLFGTPMNPEWIYEMAADVNEDDKKDLQDMIKINTFRLFGTRF